MFNPLLGKLCLKDSMKNAKTRTAISESKPNLTDSHITVT